MRWGVYIREQALLRYLRETVMNGLNLNISVSWTVSTCLDFFLLLLLLSDMIEWFLIVFFKGRDL